MRIIWTGLVGMFDSIKKWGTAVWKKYNPFDIDTYIHEMSVPFQDFRVALEEIRHANNVTIALLENELAEKEFILQQFVDVIPDMVWLKAYDENGNGGRYLYANKAIRDQLLLDEKPQGKDDVQLALAAKCTYGFDNHTFGEKCANSDLATIENWKRGQMTSKFLESGKVKGKMMYLEVHKSVVLSEDGRMIGVCGAGRILTEYIEAVNKVAVNDACKDQCNLGIKELLDVFKKYKFESED